MNFIQKLYCSQYYELKKKGKEASAKQNGTVLVTLALLLNFMAFMFLLALASPDFRDAFEDMIEGIFGRNAGRSVGKILGLIPFAIIYGIIHITYGRDSNYNNTVAEFDTYSEDQQKALSKSSMVYFIGSIVVFVLILALFLAFI